MAAQVLQLLLIGLLVGLLFGTMLGIWFGSVLARGHYAHMEKRRMQAARHNGLVTKDVPRRASLFEDYT